MSKYLSVIRENIKPSDHPDALTFTPETRERMDKIVANRRRKRKEASDPKAQRAKKAADFFSKSVIRREEFELDEETMTKADKKREQELKKKYDDSEMKANFIKQYGPEKGKSVYFAYIRKQAMKEAAEFEEEYRELPRKKMLNRAGNHNFYAGWIQGEWEGNSYYRGKKRNRTKEMVSDATSRANKIYDTVLSHDPKVAKSKSKYKPLKDSYEYDELLDEAKISRTERRARNAGKKGYDKTGRRAPRGAIHAFDVDETIFSHGVKGKPNVKVHVNDSSGKRVGSLTNQEFNTYKLPKGHSYDFSEFRSAKKFSQTTSPNKSVISKIKKLQKRGKRVQLITARDKFDNPDAFRQHFVRHGINVKPGDIHYTGGMKGGDVGKKKVAVGKGLVKMHDAKSIHMYDDAAKVHKAFEAEKGKSPKLKIKTHLAKPNKRGEVMLRSYQTTKEDFELWIENLLDEGYDLSEFTVDELYETFENLLDEAITAVGAPAPNEGPYNKSTRKKMSPMKKGLLFKSPYSQGARPIKKTQQMESDLTPYDFWKSFINENDEVEDDYNEIVEELEEDIELTPYDAWKIYFNVKYDG